MTPATALIGASRWSLTVSVYCLVEAGAITVGSHRIASADIIKCSYTEPFITTVYSTTESTLQIVDDSGGTQSTMKNISFQIRGPAQFELWDSQKRVVQKMELNFKGSDGMSDTNYPYDATLYLQNLRGGCTSNNLR